MTLIDATLRGAVSPKRQCCNSRLRCRRCPLRLTERPAPRAADATVAQLVGQILGGSSQDQPQCVAEAVLALSLARDRYLAAHLRRKAA